MYNRAVLFNAYDFVEFKWIVFDKKQIFRFIESVIIRVKLEKNINLISLKFLSSILFIMK